MLQHRFQPALHVVRKSPAARSPLGNSGCEGNAIKGMGSLMIVGMGSLMIGEGKLHVSHQSRTLRGIFQELTDSDLARRLALLRTYLKQ